jgi:hypothetical protein
MAGIRFRAIQLRADSAALRNRAFAARVASQTVRERLWASGDQDVSDSCFSRQATPS